MTIFKTYTILEASLNQSCHDLPEAEEPLRDVIEFGLDVLEFGRDAESLPCVTDKRDADLES